MPIILIVIISLSVLVFFHEFGHFFSSKIFGVKVEEFGFGYPPRIFGIFKENGFKFFWGRKELKTSSTIYSLNWIPFGGFNKLKGEFEGEEKDGFSSQSLFKRIIVLFSGAGMNIFLAFIILIVGFKTGLPEQIDDKVYSPKSIIQISYIEQNSPAEKAGLKIGDIIFKIDDFSFETVGQVQDYINKKTNQKIEIKIIRGGQQKLFEITPLEAKKIFNQASEEEAKRGAIGIGLARVAIKNYSLPKAVLKAGQAVYFIVRQVLTGFYLILKSLFKEQKMVGRLIGVVGIANLTSQAAKVGFNYLLQFLAIISVALGICQLIPFPALDGGRLLFCFIEKIKGRPISHQTESLIHNLGFIILLSLMLVITIREIGEVL